jgi:hypothetical protein
MRMIASVAGSDTRIPGSDANLIQTVTEICEDSE